MLLAIDPGNDTGWALYSDANLVACGLGVAPLPQLSGVSATYALMHVVIECPTIYPGRRAKGNPNDIIKLALLAGQIAGSYYAHGCDVTYIKPYEWKGQTPKHISAKRTLAKLHPIERTVVDAVKCAPSKRHNILDAIGLGLHVLGR